MNTRSKTFRLVVSWSLVFLLASGAVFFGKFEAKRHLLHERWGVTQTVKQEPIAPESNSYEIDRLIQKAFNGVHALVPDGQYRHIDFTSSSVGIPPRVLPTLNDNYSIQGNGYTVLVKVRATPDACSSSAHYWLDFGAIVNGFKPSVSGVSAKDVIASCQNGLLTVELQ